MAADFDPSWAVGTSHYAAKLWLMCLLAHQGLLRSGELIRLTERCVLFFADAECTVSAATLETVQGVELLIYDAKTAKDAPEVPQHVFLAKRTDAFDAVGPLLAYMTGARQRQNRSRPGIKLFGQSWQNTLAWSKPAWVLAIRALLERAGYSTVEVGSFAGHSFRSGGATDALNARMPLEAVQQQGRWKSDAWRLYHRPNPNVIRVWASWAVPAPLKVVRPDVTLIF